MSEQRLLYQRIRGRVVAMILDHRLRDGDPLPSVRASAAEWKANPLTVAKAYCTLQHQGIIEARRGVGFFVTGGGSARLKEAERAKFLNDDWPATMREIRRLGVGAATLLNATTRRFP